MDPTLFTIYEQEKFKHSLETELFIVAKITIQQGMRTIYHATTDNRPQILKSKIRYYSKCNWNFRD
jgi:hypothetical protein